MSVAGLRKRLSTVLDKPLEKPAICHPRSGLSVCHGSGSQTAERQLRVSMVEPERSMSRSNSTSSAHSRSSSASEKDGMEGGDGQGVEEPVPRTCSSPSPIRSRSPADNNQLSKDAAYPDPEVKRTRPVQRWKPTLQSQNPSQASSVLGLSLSMVVALASPLGNLLTGGDHIKNLLLLLLLIYYLNQLIEVPWSLYRASTMTEEQASSGKGEDSRRLQALSELRSLELFYLVLTVLSPFIGASLLKFIAVTISGDPNTLSWFSTSLFVLATGIRPWSHLVDRLRDRSQALQAIVEEVDEETAATNAPPDLQAEDRQRLEKEMMALKRQVQTLEKRLSAMSVTHAQEWDDIAESIVVVETEGRRFSRDALKRSEVYDKRMDVLETCVRGLQEHALRMQRNNQSAAVAKAQLGGLFRLVWSVVTLPWTLMAAILSLVWRTVTAPFRRVVQSSAVAEQSRPDKSLTTIIEETEVDHQNPSSPLISLPTEASDDTIAALDEQPMKSQLHSGFIVSTTVGVPYFVTYPLSLLLNAASSAVSIPRRILNSSFSAFG